MADGGDHREAKHRDGPAEVLVAERPEVGERATAAADDRGLDLGERASSVSAAVIFGAACRSWTGASAQTIVPRQPRRSRPARRSAQAFEPRAVTTPIVFGRVGRGSAFCGLNSPSSSSCLRSAASRASRSPSPASRMKSARKEKEGEEVAVPG